jgi:hypothetical protein
MNVSNAVRKMTITAALAIPMAALPVAQAHAGVVIGISIGIAPPPLPVYVQPPLPAPGYIWTPGYWAYGDAGYYWVPGVWVAAPQPGFLWTPAYWGWEGGFYRFHAGYWGPHVGFYGGVNYGFGYGGVGFCGGEWRGREFAYNSAVANFGGVHVTNVYRDTTIVNRTTIVNVNHVSYNGGNGGIARQPSPEESRFANERHIEPTSMQQQHFQAAAADRSQLAAVNHGRPATMAAANPAAYHQVAQQHMQSQPISAQDRQAGKSYNPNTREANQDQRIANGEKGGQINSREAAHDNQKQANIDRQVANDRSANGGRLTPQEHQQVNHEQNQASRQIANQRHAPASRPQPEARPQPQKAPPAEKRGGHGGGRGR